MLEKVPLLNLDQQNLKEQRIGFTVSISGIYNWWKKRKEKKLQDQMYDWTIADHTFLEGEWALGKGEKNELSSTEHTCSSNSFARADKIDQRIDDAIARANGSGDREGEEGNCSDDCI